MFCDRGGAVVESRKKVRSAMTENEAIKELETSIDLAKMCIQNYERKNEIQGYEMAIKALSKEYRFINFARSTLQRIPTMLRNPMCTVVIWNWKR